ncbi:MAG: YggS family pyridoxal phosphate enzyme [Acidimicrobiales bacterium]
MSEDPGLRGQNATVSAAAARSDQSSTSEVAARVADSLATIRHRIAAAGGSPAEVTVVAVTKGHGPAAAMAALDAGLCDVGENYAAALVATSSAVTAGGRRARCHFLGHVQRNKVRAVASHVHLWQGVDRPAAGAEIARRAPGAAVLVQVNVSGEAAKNGCRPEEVPMLVEDLVSRGLDVRGLMAVGPAGPVEDARPGFRQLVDLADRLGLGVRSIGMTDDLEVAVGEGSTMVRIGRGLFGPRIGAGDLRR